MTKKIYTTEDFELNIKKPGYTMNFYLGLIIDDIIREPTTCESKVKEHRVFKFCNSGDGIKNNKLTFISTGFTQTLLKEPILKGEQTLIASERL